MEKGSKRMPCGGFKRSRSGGSGPSPLAHVGQISHAFVVFLPLCSGYFLPDGPVLERAIRKCAAQAPKEPSAYDDMTEPSRGWRPGA
jgi:hypothetical protein